MADDSKVDAVVDDLLAELERDKSLTRRRMYEISLTHLGDDECSDAEGNWFIPLAVLARFRERRPAGARWDVEDEVWLLR